MPALSPVVEELLTWQAAAERIPPLPPRPTLAAQMLASICPLSKMTQVLPDSSQAAWGTTAPASPVVSPGAAQLGAQPGSEPQSWCMQLLCCL